MPQTGTLRTWNDERGFGFIAPTQGGHEVFVHVSAFAQDGSRPVVGETLSYELGRGKDGKPQALRVVRQAIGERSTYPPPRQRAASRRASPLLGRLIGLVIVVALGAYGFKTWQGYTRRAQLAAQEPAVMPLSSRTDAAPSAFRCDGRTHCSQMTSCSEAKYFLNNCPGTKMDGNHDGVPCEQQWCNSPFAK